MRGIRLGCMAGALLALVAASPGEAPPDAEAWLARGAAALRPFQEQLQAALQQGLAQGPEHAIDACRVAAPAIASAATAPPALRMGRTSHRLRNPANAPAPWMEPLLAGYRAKPGDRAPRVVTLDGGEIGYVAPIYVQPQCLACHGEVLDPGVAARLAALYPEDRATGFREGDFRGLFWVVLASPESGPE